MSPLAGIGRYAYELAKGLAKQPAITDLRFQRRLGWCQDPDLLLQGAGAVAPPGSSIAAGLRHGLVRDLYRQVSPLIKGARLLPYRDYIFHSPNYALPRFAGRSVTTVHDMSCFRHPEFHPKERVDHMRRIFPHMLKSASLFLTDSEFSKSELVILCNVDPDRVVTTYLGKDERFQPRSEALCQTMLDQFGLRYRGYTLTVGTVEPRKNLELLLDAYAGLPLELRRLYPLVIAGGYGWKSEAIHRRIAACAAEGWVKYLCYVTDEALPVLYSGARAFAYISHYEGFGLPVLEAMASGVPVITSRVASLPEVGGDAVAYVAPDDRGDVLTALAQVLDDEAYSQRLMGLGLNQAARFSWEQTVSQTVAAYERLA